MHATGVQGPAFLAGGELPDGAPMARGQLLHLLGSSGAESVPRGAWASLTAQLGSALHHPPASPCFTLHHVLPHCVCKLVYLECTACRLRRTAA